MVLLGTLLVGLVGLLGRRIGGDTVGLVAAGDRGGEPEHLGQRRARDVGDADRADRHRARCCARCGGATGRAGGAPRCVGAACGLATLARVEFVLLRAVARARGRVRRCRDRGRSGGSRRSSSWWRDARGHRPVGRFQPRALPRPDVRLDQRRAHARRRELRRRVLRHRDRLLGPRLRRQPAGRATSRRSSDALRHRGLHYAKGHLSRVPGRRARARRAHLEPLPPARHR